MEKFPVPNKTLSRIKSRSGALLRAKSSPRGKSSSSSVLSSLSQDKGKEREVTDGSLSRGQSQNSRNASGSFLSEDVYSQTRSPHPPSVPPSKRLRSTQNLPTSSPSPPPPNPNILPIRSPSPIPIATPRRVRAEPLGETRSFISDQHVFTSPFTFTTKEKKERMKAGILHTEGSADSGQMTGFSSSSSSSHFAQSARSSPEMKIISRPIRQASRALRSGLILTDDADLGARKQRKRKGEQSKAPPLVDGLSTMCVWRSQGRGEIRITRADFYRTTLHEEYLNDTLIEFGLKESFYQATIRDPDLADKVHIFNSFLYMKLTDPVALRKGLDPWETVKRWTMGKVDLFEKKYLVVPINENYHWYMAIIVNPRAMIPSSPPLQSLSEQKVEGTNTSHLGLAGASTYVPRRSARNRKMSDIREITEETDMEIEKKNEKEMKAIEDRTTPYILLFDSFGTSRPQPGHALTRYLRSEAIASGRIKEEADVRSLVYRKADVPTQSDFSSCGVYLLHYADVFFSDPELAVQQVLSQPAKKTAKTRVGIESARDIFWRSTELGNKREDISNRVLRAEAAWKASQAADMEERANEEAIEEEETDIEELHTPCSRPSSETVPDSIPMGYTLSLEPEEGSQTIYERMRLAFPSSAATTVFPGRVDSSVSPSIINPLSESRSGSSALHKPLFSDVETTGENPSVPEVLTNKEPPKEDETVFSTLRSHISPTPSPPQTPTSDHHSHPDKTGLNVSLSFAIVAPSSPPVSSEGIFPSDSRRNSHSELRIPVGETTSDLISTLPSHLSPTPSPPPTTPLPTNKHDTFAIGSTKPLSSEIIPSSVEDRPKHLLGEPEAQPGALKPEDADYIERFIPNPPLSSILAPPVMTVEAVQVPISSSTACSRSMPLLLEQGTNDASALNSSLTARGKGKRRRVGGLPETTTIAPRKSTRSTNDRAR